ncbi:MAG: DNA (cytosine-5-)-methyltransferase [Holophagaceae bacterium]|nr:DNA (cytosine-5-)-methyltransferase [Holophagaceae bacterium]
MSQRNQISAFENKDGMRIAGLFAGVGGIERGLHLAGHETKMLCELDPHAACVLEDHFPGVPLHSDITTMRRLPAVDMIAAGFPCQDLSQAGQTSGIRGEQSGLIDNLFDLIRRAKPRPAWVLLENVPFMLFLHKGHAMQHVLEGLEDLGYSWAYRIIDAHAFGLPQRRKRMIILASRSGDPKSVLLSEDAGPTAPQRRADWWCGFYWTEGNSGVGWAVNAIPPLKGGSRVGIPSPPAIWIPDQHRIVLPDIQDAERLQGFPAGWTKPSGASFRDRLRWRMVGNAVSVPVAKWIGMRLSNPIEYDPQLEISFEREKGWPKAAWGKRGVQFAYPVSSWPVRRPMKPLSGFLRHPFTSLSLRAASGFLGRANNSGLRFEPEFLEDLEAQIARMRAEIDR